MLLACSGTWHSWVFHELISWVVFCVVFFSWQVVALMEAASSTPKQVVALMEAASSTHCSHNFSDTHLLHACVESAMGACKTCVFIPQDREVRHSISDDAEFR